MYITGTAAALYREITGEDTEDLMELDTIQGRKHDALYQCAGSAAPLRFVKSSVSLHIIHP